MTHIRLAVTAAVIQQVNNAGQNQRQIAIQGASSELLAQINGASRSNRIPIPINGEFALIVGDTGAIWYAHQVTDIQKADFSSLYELLARRPDRPVQFSW